MLNLYANHNQMKLHKLFILVTTTTIAKEEKYNHRYHLHYLVVLLLSLLSTPCPTPHTHSDVFDFRLLNKVKWGSIHTLVQHAEGDLILNTIIPERNYSGVVFKYNGINIISILCGWWVCIYADEYCVQMFSQIIKDNKVYFQVNIIKIEYFFCCANNYLKLQNLFTL